MNKISKTLLVLAIIIILIGSTIFIINNKDENKLSKKDVVENIINDVFYNDSTTIKKLNGVMNAQIIPEEVFIGPDSYIRNKPSERIIKKYKLEKYEKTQDKYSVEVEDKLKSAAKYRITDYNDSIVSLEIEPWYYYNYSNDLTSLSIELMKLVNFDIENIDFSSEVFIVTEYKARIVSMRILNEYLDEYNNDNNEVREVDIEFDNDKPREFAYYTLYEVLEGATSDYSYEKDNEYSEKQSIRLKGYIEKAKKDNLLDEKSPLKV